MDLIFFEAIGNLLFVAIVFATIIFTLLFSLFIYAMKGISPALIYVMDLFGQKILKNKYLAKIKESLLILYFGYIIRPKYNQRNDYYEA